MDRSIKHYMFLEIGKDGYYVGFISSNAGNFRAYNRFKRITKWDLDHECRITEGKYLIEIPENKQELHRATAAGWNDALEHITAVCNNQFKLDGV